MTYIKIVRSWVHYGPLAIFCLSSCASLTTSQLKEVNTFGTLTKTFSSTPGQIFSTINNAHVEEQLLFGSTIHKPDDHLEIVTELYNDQQSKKTLNKQADASMQILNDYGQKLAHLAADVNSENLDTSAFALGSDLDKLIESYNSLVPAHNIPTGIGAFFGQLVATGGDLYIKRKQAEGVKEFVKKGDVLVAAIGEAIKDNLGGSGQASLGGLIVSKKADLKRNYLHFLKRDDEEMRIYTYDKKTKKIDTTMAYSGNLDAWHTGSFDADNLYLKSLTELDAAEALRVQCLAAADELVKAHHLLHKDLQEKKKIKDMYAALQGYSAAVSQVYATYKKIK